MCWSVEASVGVVAIGTIAAPVTYRRIFSLRRVVTGDAGPDHICTPARGLSARQRIVRVQTVYGFGRLACCMGCPLQRLACTPGADDWPIFRVPDLCNCGVYLAIDLWRVEVFRRPRGRGTDPYRQPDNRPERDARDMVPFFDSHLADQPETPL